MSRLSRAVTRCAVRLVPADRRDWAEALWAETDDVPPGLARLGWRAGGARLVMREARLVSRVACALVFAATAAWIVHVAWPGPASNPATAVNRLDVVVLLPALAVLPLATRRLFGPAAPGWLARTLRYGTYAAVLGLLLAKTVVVPVADNPAATPYLDSDASTPVKDGMIFTWLSQSVFLLIVTAYVAAILAITARRPRVARGTLVAGTAAGLLLGAVLYAIFPIGVTKHGTNPRLPAYADSLLVALAWLLLLGGPLLAGVVTARRADRAKLRQAATAGFLATAVGALTVTALGTATVALMPRADWLLRWLYPGQHLTAPAAYIRELTASVRIGPYGLTLVLFPLIGLAMGLWAGAAATQYGPDLGGGPPRGPGYTPTPDPHPADEPVIR